jgi:hypothetical protein
MDLINLQQFFHERPQLSAHGTALECGLSPRLVAYILTGKRSLTKRSIEKLMPVLIKYGYVEQHTKII